MSQHSARGDVGAVMGTAQTYAGISRVIAPLAATAAFQRLGHGTPFWLAAGLVVLVGLWTLRLRPSDTAEASNTSAQPTQAS